jgi:hypothetical protein
MFLVLLIRIEFSGVVDQVFMAVYTLLLETGSGVNHRPMSQHSSPPIRNIEKVPMAFLALLVLKGSIGLIAILLMIVSLLSKMDDYVFNAMDCLGVEKVEGIVRGWQVTVHAVGYKTLGIVHMG